MIYQEVNILSTKKIRFKIFKMIKSDFCDYNDTYVVVKGRISVTGNKNANRINKKLTFKKMLRLYHP